MWLHTVTLTVMLVCPLSMAAEAVDSLYTFYLNASKMRKTEMANRIFLQLKQEGFIDTLVHFDKSVSSNVVDAQTHLNMAEYYYALGKYQSARGKSEPNDKPKGEADGRAGQHSGTGHAGDAGTREWNLRRLTE